MGFWFYLSPSGVNGLEL